MSDFKDYPFRGKRVIVRVDYNVPFDESRGLIQDDTRIRRAAPTIQHIVSQGGRVVILSHMGRPKGKRNEELSLRKVRQAAESIIGKHVKFADDCVGEKVVKATKALKDGEILLLENTRFHPEEEGKVKRQEGESDAQFKARKEEMKAAQRKFAEQLARNGDCYVNDAFGTAHRAHASTAIIADYFPHDHLFGELMDQEIEALDYVMESPKHPMTAIMGGAKVSDKILIIENLLDRVDRILIGGGMSYTFIKALGGKIGNSICEDDLQSTALELLEKAKKANVEILLPIDVMNADKFAVDAETKVTKSNEIPDGWMGLDIGPETIKLFREKILDSKTILWNGPMGVAEMPPFAVGTIAVAKAVAEATDHGAYSLVGGGDSVAALKECNMDQKISYISTGGGAMLEYLEGKTLPGIAAIRGEKYK